MARWCWRKNVLELPVLRRTANRGGTCQGQAPQGPVGEGGDHQPKPAIRVIRTQHRPKPVDFHFSNTTKVGSALRRVMECSDHGASNNSVIFLFLIVGQQSAQLAQWAAWACAERSEDPDPHAQREAADFPSGTVREMSKKGTEALPNAGVMMPVE